MISPPALTGIHEPAGEIAESRAAATHPDRKRIAMFFHGLSGGGMEHSMLRLAAGIAARGHFVEIVVGQRHGELNDRVPSEVSVFEIGKKKLKDELGAIRVRLFMSGPRAWPYIFSKKLRKLRPLGRLVQLPAFADYLNTRGPDAVLVAEPQYNLIASLARLGARAKTRIVISERVQPSLSAANQQGPWAHPHVHDLLRHGYLAADAIVAVSDGVADDLAAIARIPRQRICTIYNPVVGPEIPALAKEPLHHPWFASDSPPVIMAAGRICPQKDYLTLIRAFSRVHAEREVRLVILGAEGHGCADYVQEVRSLASQHPIASDVLFAGFVDNPFTYMARASLFVLSSAYEGLPGVVIQALACGCPVVSTDCPSGPMEILAVGQYGALVPVGDDAALADAITTALDRRPIDAGVLRDRANCFSVDRAVDNYLRLLLLQAADSKQIAACQ